MKRHAQAFFAGFISTLIFHQGVLGVLYMANLLPNAPFNMTPTQPLGVPSVISLAFFGGLWGILIVKLVEKLSGRKQILMSIIYGAIGPSFVALAVVFPIKGIAFNLMILPIALLLNGAWGLGTHLIMKMLRR
jgi:MFS-type transporter involved in bile tolerance (Atg22 family)